MCLVLLNNNYTESYNQSITEVCKYVFPSCICSTELYKNTRDKSKYLGDCIFFISLILCTLLDNIQK